MNVNRGAKFELQSTKCRMLRGVAMLLLNIWLVLGFAPHAQADRARRFDADIKLARNGLLDVTENLVVDFEKTPRHGIYRILQTNGPVSTTGSRTTLQIALIRVTDYKGSPYPFTQTRTSDALKVRIGNPNTFLTGQHTYRLHYTVNGAVQVFNGKPQVYWNVTDNGWTYPIDAASAHFFPPSGVKMTQLRTQSFRGPLGSRLSAMTKIGTQSIVFSTGKLAAGSGLTFVVELPVAAVKLPKRKPRVLSAGLSLLSAGLSLAPHPN